MLAKSFDLIILDNLLSSPNKAKKILIKAIRVLNNDRHLILVQYKKSNRAIISYRLVKKEIKAQVLYKTKSYSYYLRVFLGSTLQALASKLFH